MKVSQLSKKTKIILISCLCVVCVGLPATLIGISLSSSKSDFVFGNYSSYMAPNVKKILSNKYGVSFDTYENSDAIAYNFKKNNMDLAVSTSYETSSLIKNNLLKKLDWPSIDKSINDSNDALKLFTPAVQNILTSVDYNNDGRNDNLLDYAIPYFVQDLVFIYRGEKANISDNASWIEVFEFIKNDKRFNPNRMNSNLPLLGIIDDSRTVFSLSKIVNKQKDINPTNNESIESLLSSYINLIPYISNFGPKSVLFSDSNSLLNKIANNELNGAIIYNGDGIFSAFGGDDGISIDDDTFHAIKPTDTLVALDLVVINKKISNENLNKSYDIMNDLCLKFDSSIYEDEISYLNFDYVNYTPALSSLYDFIKNGNYFNGPLKIKFLKLFELNKNNLVEKSITNLTKSNLLFAYVCFKQRL